MGTLRFGVRGGRPVTYAIRPATPQERERVAASWRTMLTLPKREADPDAGTALVGLGRFDAARGWLAQALAAAVDDELDRCEVLVADHPDAPGLPLGWLAHTGEVIHAMHVEHESRGAWVGRTLLAHALGSLLDAGMDHARIRCTILTPAGRRLLDHVLRGLRGEQAA